MNLIKNKHFYSDQWLFEHRVTMKTFREECERRKFNFNARGFPPARTKHKKTCFLIDEGWGVTIYLK